MTTIYATVESPVGELLVTTDGEAITGLYMGDHKHGPAVGAGWLFRPDLDLLSEAERQLKGYFGGKLRLFDLPLSMKGTEFQMIVWNELKTIPYGTTISYGELALRIGNPKGSRAVGLANGRNPISVIVPCHRVIAADGRLTGYGGGLPRKESLLALERSVLCREAVAGSVAVG